MSHSIPRALSALLLTAALGAGSVTTVATATAPTASPAAAKKKTGCATLKTKKQRSACTKARKSKKYRRGQVCSLSKAMGAQYRKHGYFCLDISAGQDGSLTYLEELGR